MEEPSNSAMMAEYPSPIPKNIVTLHNNLNGISQICYVENKGLYWIQWNVSEMTLYLSYVPKTLICAVSFLSNSINADGFLMVNEVMGWSCVTIALVEAG